MRLEIAVQDVPGAALAVKYGASRIELCSALQVGGLTPSQGLISSVKNAEPTLPIHVLIRPRPGNYVYDRASVALMIAEISSVRDAGATGVVIGALDAQDRIDYAVTEMLVSAAYGLHVTFHRAIDHLDLDRAVAAVPCLADIGVQRILSSGGASRAGAGLAQLAAMQEASAGRLDIMAGGGVDIKNFSDFYAAGINDVHLSAKRVVTEQPPLPMTSAAAAEDPRYFATDEDLVALAATTVGALI